MVLNIRLTRLRQSTVFLVYPRSLMSCAVFIGLLFDRDTVAQRSLQKIKNLGFVPIYYLLLFSLFRSCVYLLIIHIMPKP